MATDIRVLNTQFSDDAGFRAFAQGIAAQLAACGLVKTADTGQIDLTTATKPTLSSTAAGYEIYRFNDALQASVPIFVKVEYGTGINSGGGGLWFTVAVGGTNGAGTLTGQVGSRRQVYAGVLGLNNSYASGSMGGVEQGRVNLFWNYNPANVNSGTFVAIERPKDSTGAATADGVHTMFVNNNSAQSFNQQIPATGLIPGGISLIPTVVGGPGSAAPSPAGPAIVGLNVALVPIFVLLGKLLFGATLLYNITTIGDGASISVTFFGVQHTYLTFSQGPTQSGSVAAFPYGFAMRWE